MSRVRLREVLQSVPVLANLLLLLVTGLVRVALASGVELSRAVKIR